MAIEPICNPCDPVVLRPLVEKLPANLCPEPETPPERPSLYNTVRIDYNYVDSYLEKLRKVLREHNCEFTPEVEYYRSPLVMGTPPQAVVNLPYTFRYTVERGEAPFTFSIWRGRLPNGLDLNPITGVVTGIPVANDSQLYFVRVRDNRGRSNTLISSINVFDSGSVPPAASFQFSAYTDSEVYVLDDNTWIVSGEFQDIGTNRIFYWKNGATAMGAGQLNIMGGTDYVKTTLRVDGLPNGFTITRNVQDQEYKNTNPPWLADQGYIIEGITSVPGEYPVTMRFFENGLVVYTVDKIINVASSGSPQKLYQRWNSNKMHSDWELNGYSTNAHTGPEEEDILFTGHRADNPGDYDDFAPWRAVLGLHPKSAGKHTFEILNITNDRARQYLLFGLANSTFDVTQDEIFGIDFPGVAISPLEITDSSESEVWVNGAVSKYAAIEFDDVVTFHCDFDEGAVSVWLNGEPYFEVDNLLAGPWVPAAAAKGAGMIVMGSENIVYPREGFIPWSND